MMQVIQRGLNTAVLILGNMRFGNRECFTCKNKNVLDCEELQR